MPPTPERVGSLIPLAERALKAHVNHEPLFVTRHEYWMLKRMPISAETLLCDGWDEAVQIAKASTGIGTYESGQSVRVIVVDKLAENV